MRGEVVRSGGLTGYRRLLRGIGAEPEVMLGEAGLRMADLEDPDRYISYPAVIAAIEAPARRLGISDFGLRLAAYQDISIVGPLAFAMQNATSAYQGMRLAAENIAFQSPAMRLEVLDDPDPDLDRMTFDIVLAQPRPMAQAIEHAVGVMSHALKLISGNALRASAVHFRHQRLSAPETYRRHFDTDPVFGTSWNGMQVDRRGFRGRLPQRGRLLTEYARQFAALRAPAGDLPIDQQTVEVLRDLMRIRPATLTETARILSLHPRTLQQRLASLGTSFEALRDMVRKELADAYLAQPDIPLAHVAHLLGYSEQAVLARSCQRWFGCSPSVRRRSLVTGQIGAVRGAGP